MLRKTVCGYRTVSTKCRQPPATLPTDGIVQVRLAEGTVKTLRRVSRDVMPEQVMKLDPHVSDGHHPLHPA